MEKLLLFICMLFCLCVGIPLWATSISHVWNWFIPSIFPGVPAITFGSAMALSAFKALFMFKPASTKDIKPEPDIDPDLKVYYECGFMLWNGILAPVCFVTWAFIVKVFFF